MSRDLVDSYIIKSSGLNTDYTCESNYFIEPCDSKRKPQTLNIGISDKFSHNIRINTRLKTILSHITKNDKSKKIKIKNCPTVLL